MWPLTAGLPLQESDRRDSSGDSRMQFPVARADVIRAIRQRWLLKFWTDHLLGHRIPQWPSVDAETLKPMSESLSLLDLAGAGSETRFMIRFHGALIGEVYGSSDCRGRYLDEVIPPERSEQALGAYRLAADSGVPVYTIHDVSDATGRLVHSERLLLPFARDGERVDRVLASFEFVCLEGAFDNRLLMRNGGTEPALRLSARIEA
jgi:hypothetical protein